MYQSKLEVEERRTLKPTSVFLINTDYKGRVHTGAHLHTDTHHRRHAGTSYIASSSYQDRASHMRSYSISKWKAWGTSLRVGLTQGIKKCNDLLSSEACLSHPSSLYHGPTITGCLKPAALKKNLGPHNYFINIYKAEGKFDAALSVAV